MMPRITVRLPGMLRPLAQANATVDVDAATLADALDALVAEHPALGVHLRDETGGLRPHVLCFRNDENSRWLESLNAPLEDGDTVTIMQAVSGG